MRNWRVLTAIAAVVLAALAGVLVWKYTDDAKKDAEAPFQMQSVLVAAKRVPANTSFESALANKLIVRADRVKNDLPDTRVVDDSDENLVAAFKTQVAAHAISPGQTLVREDFVAPGQVQSGMQGTLETDQTKDKSNQLQAVSLTFDDQRSVGGFLQPGDQVNVMFSASVDKDHFFGSGGEGSGSGVKFTSFLMPGLKVLAVGSTTATPASTANSGDGTTPTTQAQTVGRNIITFEVNSRQAQQLVQAQASGTLYLTLNPTSFKKDSFKDPGEVVEAINLFDKPLPAVDRAAALKASRSGQ